MQTGCVAVRTRKGEDLGSMPVDAFIERIKADVENKA
jgi:threonyl-tRNA synthetase